MSLCCRAAARRPDDLRQRCRHDPVLHHRRPGRQRAGVRRHCLSSFDRHARLPLARGQTSLTCCCFPRSSTFLALDLGGTNLCVPSSLAQEMVSRAPRSTSRARARPADVCRTGLAGVSARSSSKAATPFRSSSRSTRFRTRSSGATLATSLVRLPPFAGLGGYRQPSGLTGRRSRDVISGVGLLTAAFPPLVWYGRLHC